MRKNSILLIALIISGCTTLGRDKETIEETINQWVQQEAYGKALDKLTNISPSSPYYADFSALRRQILSKAENYEQKQIVESSRLQKKGQLYKAIQVIRNALELHSESTVLKDFLAYLLSERKLQVEALEFKLEFAQAKYLEKTLPIHKKIAALQANSFFASRRYQNKRIQADEVALELTKIGLTLQNQDKIKTAEKYFSTALRLSGAEAIKNASQRYIDSNAVIAQSRKKKQLPKRQQEQSKKRQERQQKENLKKQLTFFDKSIRKKNFKAAKRALTEIEHLSPNDKVNKNRHARYQKSLRAEVTRTYQLGVKYHSTERYEQALVAWQNTLALDSTYEQAVESTKRVKRILAKIEKLKKKYNDPKKLGMDVR